MGFSNDTFVMEVSDDEIVSDKMVYMNSTHQFVYLKCNLISFFAYDANNAVKSNTLQTIMVNGPPFSIITFENRLLQPFVRLNTDTVSQFELYLEDLNGNPLNLQNMDWSAEIVFMKVFKGSVTHDPETQNVVYRYSSAHSVGRLGSNVLDSTNLYGVRKGVPLYKPLRKQYARYPRQVRPTSTAQDLFEPEGEPIPEQGSAEIYVDRGPSTSEVEDSAAFNRLDGGSSSVEGQSGADSSASKA
jgi:hypothetical protein